MKATKTCGTEYTFDKCGKLLREEKVPIPWSYKDEVNYSIDLGHKRKKKQRRQHLWMRCTEKEWWEGFSINEKQKLIMKLKYGI